MNRLTEEMQIGPFASLKDKAEAVPGAFGTYDCLYSHMVAVTRLKKYEDTGLEPEEIEKLISRLNEPLTIEELRELDRKDGEPVWLVLQNQPGRWEIAYGEGKNAAWITVGNNCKTLECYGETWLAYRQKPKEERHDD